MKSRSLSMALAIPVAVLFGFTLPHQLPRGQDPANGAGKAALAVGVVDLDQIAQAHPEFVRKRDALQAEHRRLREKLEEMEKEARALEGSLEMLKKNTLAYAEGEQQLRGKVAALDGTQKRYEAWIELQLAELKHETMNEIHALIDQFAKRKKLELVLRYRALPDNKGNGGEVRDRLEVYMFRDLVWHAPTVDITEDVIQFLKSIDKK